MRRYSFNRRSASRGQSFVELSLVVLLLALLLAGIAEYGLLLNKYLNLLDGVREAARYSSNYDPFPPCGSVSATVDADGVCSDFYDNTIAEALSVIYPVVLDPSRGDDIVISFFVNDAGSITRYPLSAGENGWSWSEHLTGYEVRNQNSKQDTADVVSRMDPSAPALSVLLVEIYYNYPQTLKLPVFTQVIPDPIPVYTYAIMPIKNITIP